MPWPRTDWPAQRATSIYGSDPRTPTLLVCLSALSKFGTPLSNLSQKDLTGPGTVIQLGVAPRRIDILTEITGVNYEDAQAEQLLIDIEGMQVPLISLAHLIQNKEAVGRPQDLADVARLKDLHGHTR